MNNQTNNPRMALLRDAAILQVKLLVDGIRDAILIPLSFVAALIGLLRGGHEADREFRRVIKLGRRSERWINLFGHEMPGQRDYPGGSLDSLLDRVEIVLTEQYQKGKSEAEARAALEAALQEDSTEEEQSQTKPAD